MTEPRADGWPVDRYGRPVHLVLILVGFLGVAFTIISAGLLAFQLLLQGYIIGALAGIGWVTYGIRLKNIPVVITYTAIGGFNIVGILRLLFPN